VELGDPGLSESATMTWLKAVHVLERAAGLEDNDRKTVYTITATEKHVGGEKLFSFGGFCKRLFRKFDYDMGRKKPRAFRSGLRGCPHQPGAQRLPLWRFELLPVNRLISVNMEGFCYEH